VQPAVVTGILVVHNGATWLRQCLDALSQQTRPLDRLVIVDTGSTDVSLRIASRHARIRQVIEEIVMISATTETTFGGAVRRAVGQLEEGSPSDDAGTEWLWLLHDDSAADPEALTHLLDAAHRSPSVAVAGPKLTSWDDPSRLLEVGWVITRSGRRVGGPVVGEPDQGQHDDRSDVIGVSTSGMLLRRDVFTELKGFDPAFGQFRDDLDFCWRAQLAGHRVVVAPKARMREVAASTNGRRSPDLSVQSARRRDRRHGRQVALARCSPYVAPLLALWIVVASIGSAAVLLVAKRPRGAWAELGDVASVLTPWRPMAARWRSRGTRRVRRRDLRGLFASPQASLGQTFDTIHEGVAFGSARSARSFDSGAGTAQTLETGPISDEAEPLERADPGAGWRVVRHPGFLAVLAATLLAAVAWRSLFGALDPGGLGVAGGELLPASANASEAWHSWLDGWHGAGLGNALESPPYLPVLAVGARVLEQLPFFDASTSSVTVLIAWLLAAAIPLSAGTAYLGARVVTRAPWPRAWAALAWASLATLTTAVAGGRLGAVVAHILLPLIAAGFVCVARRSASVSVTFGTALALALAAAFSPAMAVLGAVAALVLLLAGRGRARLGALVLLLVPVGLLGPWVAQVVDNPLLMLSGPGLTQWQAATAVPWQLELLHPGGPGSYAVLLSAPIVMAGLIALAVRPRREAGSPMLTVLAVLAAVGLALAVSASQVIIGRIPPGLPGVGAPITVWPGTGLDLAALALIAAALRVFGWGPGRLSLSRASLRKLMVSAVALAAVAGVLASVAMAGWVGVGDVVARQVPGTPAVAADQAHGQWGNRLLALARDRDTIAYRLVGAEPGRVVRDLPPAAITPDPVLARAVTSTVGDVDPVRAGAARDALADLGVGFVAFDGKATDPLVTRLDATAGMTRLSNNRGLILWRVLPAGNAVSPSRLRLVDAAGASLASIPVTGNHGRTRVRVGPAAAGAGSSGRRLVVAEPAGWARYARVAFEGRRLTPIRGAAQPTYLLPVNAGQLSITLTPTHRWWRWGQLALLLVVLFLAAPFGSTRPDRSP
jgi:GT2 family glycosyltransferase